MTTDTTVTDSPFAFSVSRHRGRDNGNSRVTHGEVCKVNVCSMKFSVDTVVTDVTDGQTPIFSFATGRYGSIELPVTDKLLA